MQRRILNLLAILTLVLLFFSFYRPSVNPSYDDPSANPPTMSGDTQLQIIPPSTLAYPCPTCDYPPWLVDFLNPNNGKAFQKKKKIFLENLM